MKTKPTIILALLLFGVAISCIDENNHSVDVKTSMTPEELGIELTGDELSDDLVAELDESTFSGN